MTTKAGLWIDHREAKIVFLTETGQEVESIKSDVEKHVRAAGGSRSATPYGPQDVAAGDIRDRRYQQHLNRYYKEVIKSLGDADAIFIMGPGEAKGEFQKQIKSKVFRQRIDGVETADKMTDRQMVAKVKEHFAARSQS
jgi:stalled ribosome rescue protein Dom34